MKGGRERKERRRGEKRKEGKGEKGGRKGVIKSGLTFENSWQVHSQLPLPSGWDYILCSYYVHSMSVSEVEQLLQQITKETHTVM